MRKLVMLIAFLATGWCAQAQYSLNGTVSNSQSFPLDGAHIHLDENHATASLPDGTYNLPNIGAGSHRIVISYIGYKSLDTIVNLYSNLIIDARLKPQNQQLQEVVVSQNLAAGTTVHTQKLNTATLEKFSGATLGDALREIAGVSSLRTGSTVVKPVINGLHSSRVPVFTNGVRLEDQQWGTEHAPNLDVNTAGKVTVIKGAGALQYSGDAVGGLVLVDPLNIEKDTLTGRTIMTADSNGRGGTLATSLYKGAEKGWAWNLGGTLKYLGDRQTPDYVLSNTGNREANFSSNLKYIGDKYTLGASYSFYNATIGIATATHIGSLGDLVTAINSRQPNVINPFTYNIGAPRQEVQHHLGKLNYNKEFSDSSSLSFQYAFQLNRRKEFDLRRGALENVAALDLTLATHAVNADWKKESGDNTYKAGTSVAYQQNNANPATGIRPLIPDYTKIDAGAYVITNHWFSNTLSGEAGLRYDFSHVLAKKYYQVSRWDDLGYNDGSLDHFIKEDLGTQYYTEPEFTYHNVSASLGIRKQLSDRVDLIGNVSLAMRNPNPSELFSDGLHHSNATIELGSLRTKKEESVKASVTLLKSAGRFTFELTPYVNSISNFIYLQPTNLEYTIRGAFPVYRYKQTNALMAGADLHLGYTITDNLTYGLNAAYIYAQNTRDNLPLVDMPPASFVNTIRFTQKKWHHFFAELRSETVCRQWRYPDYNFYADIPQTNGTVSTYVDISTPPAAYQLFHISTGAQFTLGKTMAAVSLSAFNLFNTTYRDYLNRQRLYVDETGRNIQLQLKLNY